MKNILEKILNFIKVNKKKVKISLILLIIGTLLFFVVNYFFTNNNISIEVASNDYNYIYGPNGETILKIGSNDIVDLKLLASDSKINMAKCYSTNEDIIEFLDKDSFQAIGTGTVEIYCKILNKESNYIKVFIGG